MKTTAKKTTTKAAAKTPTKTTAKAKAKTTAKAVLAELKALGEEKVRARHLRDGAAEPVYGAPMGELRKVAIAAGKDHALALELWATKVLDARLAAILMLDPKKLAPAEVDRMVREARFAWLAEWFVNYAIKAHPAKEELRRKWMADADSWAARAGWNLTAERVGKSPEGLDLPALLDRIESRMGGAPPETQWAMNACLATIGIREAKLRKRAVAIGEKLGVLKDYPTSKGCTSPYAPIWIAEMVRRAK